MRGKRIWLLAATVFISSMAVLSVNLFFPQPIQIYFEGSQTTVKQVHWLYSLEEVLVIVASSILCLASGGYLLFFDPDKLKAEKSQLIEERKAAWTESAKALKDGERAIYNAIIESEGMINQSELAGRLRISKAEISRTLDMLEIKSLVERRRRGMGNIVVIKK
jgi:uncharacterized membrane protein